MKSLHRFFLVVLLSTPLLAWSQQVPDVTLQTIDGVDVNLRSYIGKGPVQFSFWALWCEPCKQELKVIAKMYDRLVDSGYTLVGICEDNQKSIAKIKGYASAKEWKFPILLDPNGEALRLLNGQTIPFTVLSDGTGKISSTHVGYVAGDEIGIEKEIREMMPKTGGKK